MNDAKLCIFGEVLFDHFPDGRHVLGGAPFNVAWHLQAFGQAPHFVSRVGTDPEGEEIRRAMSAWGMDQSGLQSDDRLPTGRVDISLAGGEPSYDIVQPCAYDAIDTALVSGGCELLYHGSLALREEASAAALARLMQDKPETVFVDVNLRPPWWQRHQLEAVLQAADWVKLNADELATLHNRSRQDTAAAAEFVATYRLRGLIVTQGAEGAEILTANGDRHFARPAQNVDVVDTVGAGDAFASVIILGLLNGWPLGLTLERAQSFASGLVGNRGATVSDPAFYRTFIDRWQLAT